MEGTCVKHLFFRDNGHWSHGFLPIENIEALAVLMADFEISSSAPRVNVRASNRIFVCPALSRAESKQILKDISGVFKSGELNAVMGPSGAGKTILMNILTGFTRHGIGGNVQMNNVEISGDSYGRDCSYILQDDNLYPQFSVQETMMIAANLKIGGVTLQAKQEIIDYILQSLLLLQSKETLCAKLSGGERKRLSIALELLDNRPILFLDEPISGLDSVSATLCVRLLHKLAHEGRIIVCTIHQPEALVFELFDHVYVLTDGECAYQGSAANTISYLQDSIGLRCPQYHNPADFLIEVVNGEYGNFKMQLVQSAADERWRVTNGATQSFQPVENVESLDCTTSYGQNIRHSIPSEWTRFLVLLSRCIVLSHRDWTVTYLKWGCHVVTAIFMALMFGNSGSNATKSIGNVSMLLGLIMYIWYTGTMPSVLRFPSEFSVIKKETFNSWYSLRTYYLANMVVGTPIHMVFALTISTLAYVFTDQPLEFERFVKFSAVFIFISIFADTFGLIVGTLFDPIHGTFIASIVGIINVLFSGILAMRSQVSYPIQIVMNIMPMFYFAEALVLSLYDADRADMTCPATELYCHFKSPTMVMKEVGVRLSYFKIDMAFIIMLVVVTKLIAYFAMKKRIKHD